MRIIDLWQDNVTVRSSPPSFTLSPMYKSVCSNYDKRAVNNWPSEGHQIFRSCNRKIEGRGGRIEIIWSHLPFPDPSREPLAFNGNAIYALRKRQRLVRGLTGSGHIMRGWYSHGTRCSLLDSESRSYSARRDGMLEAAIASRDDHPARMTVCNAACRFENSWRFPGDSSEIIRKYQIGSNRVNSDSVSKYLLGYSESLEYYYRCYASLERTAVSVFSNLRRLSDTHLQCNFGKKEGTRVLTEPINLMRIF